MLTYFIRYIIGGNSLILSDPIIFQDSGTSSFILGPVNLPLNISLSCTVNNNGSFEWKWEHNGHPLQTDHSGDYWIWTADASRTTILDINTLSKAHSMGDYVCKPKHKTTDSYLSNRTISVALNSKSSLIKTSNYVCLSNKCYMHSFIFMYRYFPSPSLPHSCC